MKQLYDFQAHAIGERPEYDGVLNKNLWQEFAELTGGVGAPGNAFTVLGFAANIEACRILRGGNIKDGTLTAHDLVRACGLLAVDGFFDLLDGGVAKATGTRTPLGRRLDAGTDPIRIANSFHALWKSGIISNSVALTLGLEKVATVVPSIVANARGNEPVVSSAGKAITTVQRTAAGLYLMSAMFEQLAQEEITDTVKSARYGEFAVYANTLATVSFVGSIALTGPAAIPYVRAALGSAQKHVQA